ncbi:CCA tRNA nucleotidyltransferase [Sulfitobacter sp. F26204]|uniref:CCA tRNA nucleotidyltransferase n=1 Tax=Sulfitobacter sp. F26204 TaxID=2996014 RepID=UPI00225E609F|nr:CCA tRNA nucleotidyltransferase [Sulfitobacter sp. F26204]MCX7558271.1 CCA tRNA nucleotidyltransferase [Sulfitobacter sp. F26204]
MDQSDDIMIPTDTPWLVDDAAQELCRIIKTAGFDIFFVGGCVRNAVLNEPVGDVDFSTNARPQQVINIAKGAGLKAIPTGIDHGTVTVVVDGTAFEITTFRRDVATDGRRAVVVFSDNIADDARRRDFTMNALYATPDGQVIDPLKGMDDLLSRRIRFIEDADARIREDYLRVLRFFRFAAWYGESSQGFDADALAAIAANVDGLETLSAERVGQEMLKLLAAPDPAPAIAVMRQTGVLQAILPGSNDRLLGVLVHMENALGLCANVMCRLAVLGGEEVPKRLRLSKSDAKVLSIITETGFGGPSLAEISYRYGVKAGQSAMLIRAALAEEVPERALLENIEKVARAVFPVSAKDLMPEFEGPALGVKLAELERLWIDSGMALNTGELLARR